jgi:hypothetical protein
MKNYELVSKILSEQPELNAQSVKNDPKILGIRKKAEAIRAKAELLRSKNQIQKATLDKQRLDVEKQKQSKEMQTKYPAQSQQTEQPKQPATSQPEQTVSIEPQAEEEEPVIIQPKPGESPPVSEEVDLNSGDPINKSNTEIKEDIIEPPDVPSINTEQEELSQVPEEEPSDNEENQTTVAVSGTEPQTKDEADIARIQAQTREIQAKIGEYTPPGGAQNVDPSMAGSAMPGNPSGMTMGPGVGGMGGITDPAMMGMEQQPPDPMKGFGDTTDPSSKLGAMGMGMGMGGIDPMTGMPTGDMGPSKTPTAIGRLYLIKKIYYRLALLDKVLTDCPDPEVLELSNTTREAFDIFRLVIQNLKNYKEKIDEIIIDYYMLLKDIGQVVENHFKSKNLENQE